MIDAQNSNLVKPKSCSSGLNDIATRAISAISNCISRLFTPSATVQNAQQTVEDDIQTFQEQEDNKAEKATNDDIQILGEQKKNSIQKTTNEVPVVESEIKRSNITEVQLAQQPEVPNSSKTKQEGDIMEKPTNGSARKKNSKTRKQEGKKNSVTSGDKEIHSNKASDQNGKIKSSQKMKTKNKKTLNHLLEQITTEAMNADDKMFDAMYDKLKNEFDRLVCECPGTTPKNKNSKLGSSQMNDTSELRELISELDELVRKRFCDCKIESSGIPSDSNMKTSSLKKSSADDTVEKSKTNSQNVLNIEKEESGHSDEFLEFLKTILRKLDEIFNHTADSELQEFEQRRTIGHFGDPISEEDRKSIKIKKEASEEKNDVDKIDKIDLNAQTGEKYTPLEEFVNFRNELKDVLYRSSCKCNPGDSLNDLKRAPEVRMEDGDESFTTCEELLCADSSPTYPLLQKAAEDTLRLSDFFMKPAPIHPPDESPVSSFHSAECPRDQKNVEGVEVAVNTQCKCFTDQITQTFEDMKISYGVVCAGQSTSEDYETPDMTDVEVKRIMSEGGDVEKLKIRVHFKEDTATSEIPEMENLKRECNIEKSPRFIRTFTGYTVKYETTDTEIEEPKVVTIGDSIKILIPLDSDTMMHNGDACRRI